MQQTLRKVVTDKQVIDCGAGSLELSNIIANLGALSVTALDPIWANSAKPQPLLHEAVTLLPLTFKQFLPLLGEEPFDVAVVSWPINNEQTMLDLLRILRKVPVVVYIGSNFNGSACASPVFFQQMLRRRLVAEHEDLRNTMLVYGSALAKAREPTDEESAGMDLQHIRARFACSVT